ncbi:MAG: ferritin [Bacteroidetes bacterium]|nr:ferritin [Bacteroidota bacterium]MCW5894469.1 ferritin [Bacteroidota bacterium]
MLSKTILNAFDTQIKNELEAAYLYLSMSSYCNASNFPGFGKWLRAQAQEELGHGMKLFDYVHHRGSNATLQAIAEPKAMFKNIVEVFDVVYEHEQKVTGLIHKLYEAALKENDYASQIELQWFITEQVEEEQTASMIVEQLKMIGDNKAMLLMMDRQMGVRGAA